MLRTLSSVLGVLALLAATPRAGAAPHALRTVRLTTYTEWGITYSGAPTAHGLAGCSWDIPLGATIVLPDGQMAICADRGIDDGVERIDLWNGDGGWGCVPCTYGDWVEVEVW